MKVGNYKHYKGKRYEVIGLAKDSQSLQDFVVYRPLYKNKYKDCLWIRPKKEFLGTVIINSKVKKRFEYIGDKNV